jgi:hypothetical protein
MGKDIRPGLYSLCAGLCLLLSYVFASEWEAKLVVYPEGGQLARAQSAGGGGGSASQRIYAEGGSYHARYGFTNFSGHRIDVSYSMRQADFNRYMAGYGYRQSDLDALQKWREDNRQLEWARAVKRGGETEGKKALEAVEWEYRLKREQFFKSRGFSLGKDNVLMADMPGIVKRNVPTLRPLALALQEVADGRGFGQDELIGSVLSLVQTALTYRVPPMKDGGTHTGGILPPAKSLLSGWGDCDTKTGVAGAILGSWSGMRLVGVSVPGHYLMAIRRLPGKGDVFVRHEGLEYVLIEPAGPAWLEPGRVGQATMSLLEGMDGYKIEPFF